VLILVMLLAPLFAGAASFDRDLYAGMRGNPDVVRMQDFLRSRGYFNYSQSTGNYFTLTIRAVQRFQAANGITPVSGYFGPKSRALANALMGTGGSTAGTPSPSTSGGTGSSTGESPYKGKIVISEFYGTASRPSSERITLRNTTKNERITVSGFWVENARGESFTVPLAYALPGGSGEMRDPILLAPGERVYISLGRQERRMNFRENLCTGYFDEFSDFTPGLDHQCPDITLPDRASYTDRCIRLIEGTGSCRAGVTEQFTDSRCATFINDHLNYNGCVRDNKNRDDFYLKRWLVWMQRDQEFFRNLTETVTVRDQNGRKVDERSY